MSNTARKARKRAGIKFERKQKTPTPVMERNYITQPVPGPAGTLKEGRPQMRSSKKIDRYLKDRLNTDALAGA